MKADNSVEKTKIKASKSAKKEKYKYAYGLIAPAFIHQLIFGYLPFLGLVLAFKKYQLGLDIWEMEWVGLDNFKNIFADPDLVSTIWRTLLYGIVIIFGGFPFPIILALLFNEIRNMPFKKTCQTISYMPYFLSWISVIGLFYAFFATEGPFNDIMKMIYGDSWEAKNILMDSSYFLPIIYISHLWKNVGYSSVLFLAAIAGIDQSMYEAATIDGCGKFRQAWSITIPSIKSTIIITLVMSLGSLFNTNFEQVYGFQNVYVQDDTDTIGTVIYRRGIQSGKYDLATAFGLAQGLISVALIFISNTICKKLFDMSIW